MKLLNKYKNTDSERPESIKQLCAGKLFISIVTKIEIISVLGKYARGNSAGRDKCNCIISEDGSKCSNYKYTTPRKRWTGKQIKSWLQLIKETTTGESAFAQLELLPFSEKTLDEAQYIVLHALKYNFGSMDAIIAATAKESIDNQESIIVVTADKGLKACLQQCDIPYWDAFAQEEGA